MPGSWKSDILFNALLVARADGALRPIEVLMISTVRAELGADKRTLADAVMRSFDGTKPASGSLIQDEQSLRAMVEMALIDGEIAPCEHAVVTAFIDAARVPRLRVEAIVRESIERSRCRRDGIQREIDVRWLAAPSLG
jgi:hypothetical protein